MKSWSKFIGRTWIVCGALSVIMMLIGVLIAFVLPADIKGREINYLIGGVISIAGLIFSLVMFSLGINTIKPEPQRKIKILNLIFGLPVLIMFSIMLGTVSLPFSLLVVPAFIIFMVVILILDIKRA